MRTGFDGHVDLSEVLAKLELELSHAIALRSSEPLRLAILRGRASVVVTLPLEAGHMRVSADALSLSRQHPGSPSDPPLNYADFFAEVSSLWSIAKAAEDASLERARGLVAGLFLDDRWNPAQLLDWAPLIEGSIYGVGARIVDVLDRMRRLVRDACFTRSADADTLVVSYRRFVDALGRTTLIGTDAGAPWLPRMAARFSWSRWTPSFPLTRERDLLSAAIGARAASRFGPTIIEHYFGALRRAEYAHYALDAIVGLSGIGMRHSTERKAIIQSLHEEVAKLSDRAMPGFQMVVTGHTEARRLLTEGRGSDFGTTTRWKDAFNLDPSGRMPVFGIIEGAVQDPVSKFVRASKTTGPISPFLARVGFYRAWDISQS